MLSSQPITRDYSLTPRMLIQRIETRKPSSRRIARRCSACGFYFDYMVIGISVPSLKRKISFMSFFPCPLQTITQSTVPENTPLSNSVRSSVLLKYRMFRGSCRHMGLLNGYHLIANATRHPFSHRHLHAIPKGHLHTAIQIDRHSVNRRIPKLC